MRNTIAVAICSFSSLISIYCVFRGFDIVATIWILACIWRLTAHWLDRRFGRWHLSMKGLVDEFKSGRLSEKSPIVKTMDYGFDVLALSAIVLFLIRFFGK